MWGITIFGLVVIVIVVAIIFAIGAARLRGSSPGEIRDRTEREMGVPETTARETTARETTVGVEDSPLNRPKTGA